MTDDCILAIDNGTQSVRALLFDATGQLLAKSQVHLEPYFSKQPKWAEQHADYYWDNLCLACQQLWQQTDISKAAIKGVAVTTQRNTMINLDAQGQPLRPAIVWMDQRETDQYPQIRKPWPWLFKLAGVTDTVDYFQRNAEANWLAQHQPELWAKTDKFLFLSGYLNYRLCGDFVDSVASQIGFLPFDYKRLDWASSSDWKWQAVPVQRSQLADLYQPGTQMGVISQQAAEATGIPAGLPLFAAAADKACEVLGSGCLEPGIACLSYGTTATVNMTTRKYLEPIKYLPPYPAAIPDHYNTEMMVYRGYWMVSWFKREFGLREEQLAEQRGVITESLFDELIKDVPPGAMGLMLQPYWSAGIRNPGPEAKGAIIGFGDVHTRAHVYRAILEGLAYALREGLEKTEARSKTPITQLRVSGGGSQSDAAMQLTADIFNRPAARPHVFETSGLGAAMDVAVGLGMHSDFATAAAKMTRLAEIFEPQAANVEIYEALYERVYKRMYPQLATLYQEIRQITGYPE